MTALLALLVVGLLAFDWRFFARGRDPSFREALIWSLGWLLVSVAVAIPLLLLHSEDVAVNYITVYFIERSLSLDNLFVFVLLFAYFAVPGELRAGLLFWGIGAALVLRALAIFGGIAVLEEFSFLTYVLGVALLALAMRVLRGIEEDVKPEANLFVRLTRRFFPVTGDFHGRRWFVQIRAVRHTTPLFLCLGAVVLADIVFAIDSIPAAFGITREPEVIWMANAFALLGLRALFVLVEGLRDRFRYIDQTIACVLALVAMKLLAEDLVHVSPELSLIVVLSAFAAGILASVLRDRTAGLGT